MHELANRSNLSAVPIWSLVVYIILYVLSLNICEIEKRYKSSDVEQQPPVGDRNTQPRKKRGRGQTS